MESELAGPRVPPALAGYAQTPTGRLLASGSVYLPRLPGGHRAARVSALWRGPPVACVAFVSGYSCGAATVSHRVPGLIGPCPSAGLQTQGAGTTVKRIPSGACADGSHTHSPPSREIRTPVSWLPGHPTCRAFPEAVGHDVVSHSCGTYLQWRMRPSSLVTVAGQRRILTGFPDRALSLARLGATWSHYHRCLGKSITPSVRSLAVCICRSEALRP